MQRKIGSLRELEEQYRKQAELSATPETRIVLEEMAREYRVIADWLESNLLEIQQVSPSRTSDYVGLGLRGGSRL
jgi:hypothetical protein